jgi:transcriptional regulator with XRE-family HTH domain
MINIKSRHIRAARGWLGWGQQELADRSGVSLPTITRLENDIGEPEIKTLEKIASAFEAVGGSIEDDGIRFREQAIRTFSLYTEVLDDMERALGPGQEILFHCADDKRSSGEVIQRLQSLREKGIRIRNTVCRGNSFITGSPDEYRWIDEGLFSGAQVSAVYADRYVVHLPTNPKLFLMITNAPYADVMRQQFEYFWENGKTWQQEKTTKPL